MPDRREPGRLSLLDASMLVMGGIIGVGIFYTPRAVAELVPGPIPFLAVWAVGGLVALCGALTFAELGATFPRAGGWFVFLREAWGPFVAFLFAWVVMGVIATGAVAVMLEIFTANLAVLVPALGPPRSLARLATGAAALALVTGIAALGTKTGATFQNACMAIKLVAILALVAGGLFLAAPAVDVAAAAAPAGGGVGHGGDDAGLAAGMVRALLPVLFACGGWHMVCYVAPQIARPERNLPRAIVLGVGAVVVLYLLLNATYVRVLGMRGLAADPGFAGRVAEIALGPAGGKLLQGAIAVSALGVCVVTIVTSPWMYVAMAREGLFFARIGELHPRTGAPVAALMLQGAIALVYWLWGRAETLVGSVVFVEWIFHGLVALALLALRAKRPELPRPFRSPAWPLAPAVYVLIAGAVVLGNLAQANMRDTAIGLAVLAAGVVAYRPWRELVALRTRARGAR